MHKYPDRSRPEFTSIVEELALAVASHHAYLLPFFTPDEQAVLPPANLAFILVGAQEANDFDTLMTLAGGYPPDATEDERVNSDILVIEAVYTRYLQLIGVQASPPPTSPTT